VDGGAVVAWLSALGRALGLPLQRRPVIDPFATLEVQLALSRLDQEIARIQRDDAGFARAHHLSAAVAAYGQALDEACRLAGITPAASGRRLRRVLAEAELRSRGWDW
jgi:hypothetical protein